MGDGERNLDQDLSMRLYHALTARKEEIFSLLQDPEMDVQKSLLKNPFLDDKHLLVMLKRRDLSEELLKSISKNQRVAESHELKLALARNVRTPAAVLTNILPHLYLFELLSLCKMPGLTPDQKMAAERHIIQRIPATPLGSKFTLARQGTPLILEKLIQEGDPRIVQLCLDNPLLREATVYSFLGSSNATPETISQVARHQRWKEKPGIRQAILKNGRTPLIWFTLLLPKIKVHELKELLAGTRLVRQQKVLVEAELARRGF